LQLKTTFVVELICIVKRSAKNLRVFVNKHCLQTTDHTRQGCQMRTKNNVHSNSII